MPYPGQFYPGQFYPSQPASTPISVSDLATVADSAIAVQTNNMTLGTEPMSFGESASIIVSITSSDSFAETDTQGGRTATYARSDTAPFTEQFSSSATNSTTDTGALNEAQFVFEGFLKDVTEILSLSESTSIFAVQSTTDTGTSVDTRANSTSCPVNDLTSFYDSKNLSLLGSELLSFSDVVQPRFNYLYTADSYIWKELLAGNFSYFKTELGVFNETCFVSVLQVVTDDPFDYPEYLLPTNVVQRDLRVIAQDHFTREIVHWDLPVDNVQITFTLSGPNLFKATITSEMEAVYSLDPPLIPDRTWLHVEENNQIVASFIMTPIIEDIGSQSRNIEGEGFSAYPHWVTYEGPSYVGIQIDPGLMIKKIWDHVQSFPDGNLKVIAEGVHTPIRIGYPADNVDYQTVTGIDVDANNGGPYLLNFWSALNCGEEIDKLCKENSIEYYERSYWNAYHTDIQHEVVFGYPRVGGRNPITIREGENLYQVVPSYQEDNENYASDVLVIGAGTGPGAIRAKASGRIGRLRKTKVIQNQNISRVVQAQEIARFEFSRINESRFLIDSIILDLTHPNSRLTSFMQGDDIYLQCDIPYVGYVQRWYRIVSYQYDIYTKTAALSLEPSESFAYGGNRVDPTSYLPSSGFAMVSHHPLPRAALIAYQRQYGLQDVEAVGEFTDDALEAYKSDAVWYVCQYHNIGAGIPPGKAAVYEVQGLNVPWKLIPIENLSDGGYTLVLARTEGGQYFVGDNVFFMDSRGNFFGQRPDKTTQLEIPLILTWAAAYANRLIQVWQADPKLITPGLKFPGSDSVPGAIQGPYNNYIIAKVYYGWGGTYSANGPGPELFGIMTALATGVIYPY